MVNVATGSEEHKERVMATCTPSVLGRFLADESNPQIRVAAVWWASQVPFILSLVLCLLLLYGTSSSLRPESLIWCSLCSSFLTSEVASLLLLICGRLICGAFGLAKVCHSLHIVSLIAVLSHRLANLVGEKASLRCVVDDSSTFAHRRMLLASRASSLPELVLLRHLGVGIIRVLRKR